jgi:hypothetical protein
MCLLLTVLPLLSLIHSKKLSVLLSPYITSPDVQTLDATRKEPNKATTVADFGERRLHMPASNDTDCDCGPGDEFP